MIRVIPRLDVKNDTVVKGIRFEGLRTVGQPLEMAHRTKFFMKTLLPHSLGEMACLISFQKPVAMSLYQ